MSWTSQDLMIGQQVLVLEHELWHPAKVISPFRSLWMSDSQPSFWCVLGPNLSTLPYARQDIHTEEEHAKWVLTR